MKRQRSTRKHTVLEKIRREANLDRRGIKYVVGAASVIGVILTALFLKSSLPVTLTDADRAMLTQYQSIRLALSQDDLVVARQAAATLATSYEDRRGVAVAVLALSKADSLEAARDAFSAMSIEAVRMARGHGAYYIVGCAMNQCPAPCLNCQMWRFSDWVQTDPSIANPFMGKTSPHCGVIR